MDDVTKQYLDGLIVELEGYEKSGNKERAAEVKAEISRVRRSAGRSKKPETADAAPDENAAEATGSTGKRGK